MCEIVTTALTALTASVGTGGAAAGAATGLGGALQTAGLIAAVAGPIVQGVATKNAADAAADGVARQRDQVRRLNAIEDQRTRQKFRREIARQTAQLAERGLDLASPTAQFLGQTAAKELAFASQSVRQRGASQAAELTSQERALRARGRQGLLRGGFSAAGQFLRRAPDKWPELLG